LKSNKKVLLIILDGWGLSPAKIGNAPFLAKTPVLDYVYSSYPKTSLSASGLEVGLSAGEPGNSEVGHMSIGLGRVAMQNLPRIDNAIASQEFFENPVLNGTMEKVKKNKGCLHLIGLVSDGGVHSHIRHLITLLEMARNKGVKDICVHAITDGRDTPPEKAKIFLQQIAEACSYLKVGRIATIVGRYYAMDRDKNWDRQKMAYDLFVSNTGERFLTVDEAIDANYKNKVSDEFITPCVIGDCCVVKPSDSIIFYNHRSDRFRQLLMMFEGRVKGFTAPKLLDMVSMTQYDEGQTTPIVFLPQSMTNTLSEMISKKGLTQFHTAETEKFAHVTYFLKAGVYKLFSGEKDVVTPSKKVPSYDKIPEMSSKEITEQVNFAIKKSYNFIVVNYANGDMVGHTGVLPAGIKACEAVDSCLGQILSSSSAASYKVFITADHGNCEGMINDVTKSPSKEHSTNPVPFVFLDFIKKPYAFVPTEYKEDDYMQYAVSTPIGVLADVAPSVLANLDVPLPKEMSGMDLSIAML
jgi:2,3-bisphosphoglycerate-independent phosphoglycerate mutase